VEKCSPIPALTSRCRLSRAASPAGAALRGRRPVPAFLTNRCPPRRLPVGTLPGPLPNPCQSGTGCPEWTPRRHRPVGPRPRRRAGAGRPGRARPAAVRETAGRLARHHPGSPVQVHVQTHLPLPLTSAPSSGRRPTKSNCNLDRTTRRFANARENDRREPASPQLLAATGVLLVDG